MRAKFMHIADVHLGYWQYHLRERYNDFARAFISVVDIAVDQQVDFVLLAGDLFDRRSIDALTLNQAIYCLKKLRQAGIPCIAVEGNHELAYHRDSLGWMEFLARQEYLILLDPEIKDGEMSIQPYIGHKGAYFDPVPGLRVYGMRYLGASTASALGKYAEAMMATSADGIEYTVFMTHAGIEGVLAEQMGGLSHSHIAPMRDHTDYVALGHIHKPYAHDDWIYNPGSLETCSVTETAWENRGYYMVDVDTQRLTEDGIKHRAQRHKNQRRKFDRIRFRMDHHLSPEAFYTAMTDHIVQRAKDYHRQFQGQKLQPVVEVQLTGIMPFDHYNLDLSHIEQIVNEFYEPLYVQVKNLASPAEYAVEAGDSLSRPTLEHQILSELFGRDARYRGKSASWARAAISLKRMALEGLSAESIVDDLQAHMETIASEPEQEPSEDPSSEKPQHATEQDE